jgi:hypothetical protein
VGNFGLKGGVVEIIGGPLRLNQGLIISDISCFLTWLLVFKLVIVLSALFFLERNVIG